MRRREFITLFGGAAAAWPLTARAQQPAMPVIGFLGSASPNGWARLVAAFRKGLNEVGYVESQNIVIEYRWAEGHYDQLPSLATELVDKKVSVIVAAGGDASALAAKAATTTIPIVFTGVSDPVKSGLVASLSRPSGNITGFTQFNAALNSKRLELLKELVPTAVIGVLINSNSVQTDSRDLQTAARALGLQLNFADASGEPDIDTAFASLVQRRSGAILVAADPFFFGRREPLVALAARYVIPTIWGLRQYAEAGGLMSYGGSITDGYHQTGVYVGHILKGAKVGDLPVQQSTQVEFVINMKTAKTLGITFPTTLLGRADEVIE
jgi:putative ABC transport system substrate-binding protein